METGNISSPERDLRGTTSRRLKTACVIQLLALIAAWLPAKAQAQFLHTTNNGTITITGYTGPGGDVSIPDTINGWPVTSIYYGAFRDLTNLTGIIIPDSVTDIGPMVFSGCSRLASVDLGGITNVSYQLFSYCGSLTNITLPGGITSIEYGAFFLCTALARVEILGRVTHIGPSAFYLCTSMENFNIPNSVTAIGDFAFGLCGLTNIAIPSGVTSIGYSAFAACRSLTAITVGTASSHYVSIDGVLFNKSQTTLIQCPGNRAGNYTISNSVTNIGPSAFVDCGRLTNVTIPDSVTSIGNFAFWYCANLTEITIPSSVTVIGYYAFSDCYKIQSVAIPSSVTSIGESAFANCAKLATVTIANGVTNIGIRAFAYCASLTVITIPSSVISIDEGAFYFSASLEAVYFQGNAPGLGSSVFEGANTVTTYFLPGTTGWGPTFGDRPTALWLPQVSTGDASFGVRTNQYGFNIHWASGRTVVVEACEDLAIPIWTPVGTKTLTEGSSYFSDPHWTNSPARFYRLREW